MHPLEFFSFNPDDMGMYEDEDLLGIFGYLGFKALNWGPRQL